MRSCASYIAAVFAVTFLAFSSRPTLAHVGSAEIIIHMTEDGFEPTDVKIARGEKVIFENVDTKPHWPASNIHPTLDALLEDAGGGSLIDCHTQAHQTGRLAYNMQEALGVCDELGDQFSKTSCYGGVFMESIVTGG